MTIQGAIELVDRMKPNQYEAAEKVRWLSELDELIYHTILTEHETEVPEFTGYSETVDVSTVLLVTKPYEEIYRWWLEMKIDDANAEVAKYNNSAAKYNTYLTAYRNWYNRNHMPKQHVTHFTL